jgi:hypothetical protein
MFALRRFFLGAGLDVCLDLHGLSFLRFGLMKPSFCLLYALFCFPGAGASSSRGDAGLKIRLDLHGILLFRFGLVKTAVLSLMPRHSLPASTRPKRVNRTCLDVRLDLSPFFSFCSPGQLGFVREG